jgi:predicted permease
MSVVANLGYMLLFLCAGVAGRALGVITPARRDRLNDAAFHVALPAVVFTATYTVSPGEVVSVPLLGGLWLTLAAVLALGWAVHRVVTEPAARRIGVVQSYHANYGFLGVPIVALAFGQGSIVTAKASLLLGVGALTQTSLTVSILLLGEGAGESIREQLSDFLTNPVVFALLAGLAVGAAGVGVPDPALAVLNPLSSLALPAALLGVGSSLALDTVDVDLAGVASVVALKTVAMPLLAVLAFAGLGANPTTLAAGAVMTAMPTAVSTSIYAVEFDSDAAFASLSVFSTTFASLGTLLVVLYAFG